MAHAIKDPAIRFMELSIKGVSTPGDLRWWWKQNYTNGAALRIAMDWIRVRGIEFQNQMEKEFGDWHDAVGIPEVEGESPPIPPPYGHAKTKDQQEYRFLVEHARCLVRAALNEHGTVIDVDLVDSDGKSV